jgi:hypothetical protein
MENIIVADTRIFALIALYDWQTDFFKSVLDGISDNDTQNRMDTKANHIAWLAGSIVQQRYELAQHLLKNESLKQQADDLFIKNQGIKDDAQYPPLAQYLQDWEAITPKLREALVLAGKDSFDEKLDMGGMQMSFFDWFTFSIYREANQIGQIALWRRLLGYEPMKYM